MKARPLKDAGPQSVKVGDREITRSQFIEAWSSYQDDEGNAYDPGALEFQWLAFAANEVDPRDQKPLQETLMPLIESYL